MLETDFIRQNKDKWAKDELIFEKKNPDPDAVSDTFTEITEDLSFARTFYSFRSVRVYLNQMAQTIYFKLNTRKISFKNIFRFWTDEVPQAMAESRKDMNVSVIIFFIGVIIGVVSTVYDPEFPRIILGDGYVNQTLENIAAGDPMKIYKDNSPFDMFLGITANNLLVAYRVFVLGIVFSVGTGVMLFYNAIMLGSFQFFFFQHAVFMESILAIWLHGTLEISAIILAGGAGLTLGRGLLFPGTLSRRQAFQLSAQRGLKIMLGITPVFILAAIIESFATRYTDAPSILRVLIILSSLAFILGYYVWVPWKKSLSGFDDELEKYKLPPDNNDPIIYDEVKNTGMIFYDIFRAMRKMGKMPIWAVFFAAFSLTFFFLFQNSRNDLLPLIGNDWFLFNLGRYFTFYEINLHFTLNTLLFSLVLGSVIYRFLKINNSLSGIGILRWLTIPALVFLWQTLFLIPGSGTWWWIILGTPFLFLILAGIFDFKAKPNPGRITTLVFTRVHHTLFVNVLLIFVAFILFFVVYSPIIWFYYKIIKMNIDMSDKMQTMMVVGAITFVLTFVFFLVSELMLTGALIIFYSVTEARYAEGLMKKIKNIKIKKLAYGLERESE